MMVPLGFAVLQLVPWFFAVFHRYSYGLGINGRPFANYAVRCSRCSASSAPVTARPTHGGDVLEIILVCGYALDST
jgi:hypothetical protein